MGTGLPDGVLGDLCPLEHVWKPPVRLILCPALQWAAALSSLAFVKNSSWVTGRGYQLRRRGTLPVMISRPTRAVHELEFSSSFLPFFFLLFLFVCLFLRQGFSM